MAELDYGFLAEYATVQGSKLTAVGASFTHVDAAVLPALMTVYVAGRIRAREDERDISLQIRLTPPGAGTPFAFSTTINPSADVRPYDGKMGLLFAFGLPIQLAEEGLYTIFINVDGKDRRLAFGLDLAPLK